MAGPVVTCYNLSQLHGVSCHVLSCTVVLYCVIVRQHFLMNVNAMVFAFLYFTDNEALQTKKPIEAAFLLPL